MKPNDMNGYPDLSLLYAHMYLEVLKAEKEVIEGRITKVTSQIEFREERKKIMDAFKEELTNTKKESTKED